MGLDITIKVQKPVVCPKCGEVVTYTCVDSEDSDGRVWYELLDKIGYKNDEWYAEDMMLTEEQTKEAYDFVTRNLDGIYQGKPIRAMISFAILERNKIVINANW